MMNEGLRIAVDIGGTFTDIACLTPSGALLTAKVPSTPDDFGRAVIAGIEALARRHAFGVEAISEVLHASTVATNAILERKGARTALLTTEGFRDVLELRRIRVPRLYDPLYEKPAPLAGRRDRYDVSERMGAAGEVVRPLDLAAARATIKALPEEVAAIAICLLHSYANPAHEVALGELVRQLRPDVFVSISSDVLPEIKEYERTSTTVVNAYVGPLLASYLSALQRRLEEAGISARLSMMHSSGGITDVHHVIKRPVQVIESGPAAGVVGAAHVAVCSGIPDVIAFDMGGTTAKASLIEGGRMFTSADYEVGGGISMSSSLVKGGGYALKLPVIDISEVGAGGGSIVRLDVAGVLKVGPDSAGAHPGPACYGRGGADPTVTDASVVLGWLNPTALAGGTVAIDAAAADRAIAGVAAQLACDVRHAAWGIHRIANATMMRAIKSVSTYRGRDPREFTLLAFGGNGGIHAASLAVELGMRRVVVPRAAGVFSALGLLYAPREECRSFCCMLEASDEHAVALSERLKALEDEVFAELGVVATGAELVWRAELRYETQAFDLPTDLPPEALDAAAMQRLRSAFAEDHLRIYGYNLPEARVYVVTLRVIGRIYPEIPMSEDAPTESARPATTRSAYWGPCHGTLMTDIFARAHVGVEGRVGPLIIEDDEGTTMVPPGALVRCDLLGNLVIDL